jgi:hypothetical protein
MHYSVPHSALQSFSTASCTTKTFPLCILHSRILHCAAFSPTSCTVQCAMCILYSVYALFNIIQYTHIKITLPGTCTMYNVQYTIHCIPRQLQPESCILHPAFCILYPVFSILDRGHLNPASCILHSCILHTDILHHASCIPTLLHLCILHTASFLRVLHPAVLHSAFMQSSALHPESCISA